MILIPLINLSHCDISNLVIFYLKLYLVVVLLVWWYRMVCVWWEIRHVYVIILRPIRSRRLWPWDFLGGWVFHLNLWACALHTRSGSWLLNMRIIAVLIVIWYQIRWEHILVVVVHVEDLVLFHGLTHMIEGWTVWVVYHLGMVLRNGLRFWNTALWRNCAEGHELFLIWL